MSIDFARAFAEGIKDALGYFASKLGEAFKPLTDAFTQFLRNFKEMVIDPLWNAIIGFISWLWSAIANAINTVVQAIVNFFYDYFIKPIYNFFQTLLNRIISKLDGILFILFTLPPLIKTGKEAIEEGVNLKKIGKMFLMPITGYLTSQLVSEFIKSMITAPITIKPPQPPAIPTLPIQLPSLNTIPISPSDRMNVSDSISVELIEKYLYARASDYINFTDMISIQTLANPQIITVDRIPISDTASVKIISTGISARDSINISDVTQLTLINPATANVVDSIRVSDYPSVTVS